MKTVEVKEVWWKIWEKRRYVLCFMCHLGVVNFYTTRININVALVAMTGTSDDQPTPEFDWTPQMKGYLLSAFFYCYVFMQIPSSIIVKRVPPHILFGLAVIVSAAITALTPLLANDFYVLLVARVIMGFFQAFMLPISMQFVATWGHSSERAMMTSVIASGASVGTIFTMPISGLVGEFLGWQWIFYVFAICAFVWCVVWVLSIKSTPEEDKFISNQELEYIRQSAEDMTEKDTMPVPWKSILTSTPVWALTLAHFTWGWGFQTMLAQLPQYMKEVSGFDLAQNGLLNSLPYVTLSLMAWISGYMADFLSEKGYPKTAVRKAFYSIAVIIQSICLIAAAFIETPTLKVLFISLGVGVGAFSYTSLIVNPLDLGPIFSPVIVAVGNTGATIPGILSPILTGYIVTADKKDTDTLAAQWQVIFFISAGMYLFGCFVHCLFASAELQDWAKVKNSEKISRN